MDLWLTRTTSIAGLNYLDLDHALDLDLDRFPWLVLASESAQRGSKPEHAWLKDEKDQDQEHDQDQEKQAASRPRNSCKVKSDPALLRPGRLIGSREFRRLTRAQAQQIAEAKGLQLAEQPDYSLGELYCGVVNGPVPNTDRQMGFSQ